MKIKSALIVDDSQMARIVLKKQLVSRELTVFMAESGEDSINFLENNETLPDIIFMDCLMPGMDGYETTSKILQNPQFSNIPIVMCTGKESDDDKQKAFDMGAAGYMSKSSSSEPLDAILDEFNKQEIQMIPTEKDVELKERVQLSESTIRDLASEVATNIAKDITYSEITLFSEEFTHNFNKQFVALTEQLEEKVIFSVKKSLEDTHDYVDNKVSDIEKRQIPALKVELYDLTKNAIDDLKSELDKVDMNSMINDIVDKKIRDAIEHNLSSYVTVLLEHEVAQSLIDKKIQDQLAEQKNKIHSLEYIIDNQPKSNLNMPNMSAIIIGLTALAVSLYPFIKHYL
ncbi:MAG: response regulator [Gammaproteobacteria bacterium]|nr:response regulator [Gammaproteobacteria bacterium]